MKRGVGVVLAGLGAFLLVLALLLKFVAVPKLAVAPLTPGTDGISTSLSIGVAKTLFYPGKIGSGENPTRTNVPLTATRTPRGDVLASTTPEAEAANLVVWDSFQNVVDDEGATIDASTIRFAFNRTTSELTNCCGGNVDGEAANFVGIAPFKFPFYTEQKDYDWYDSGLDTTAPAKFLGTDTIEGVLVYKFQQIIPPYKSGELEVPGDLVGSTEASVVANRYKESDTIVYIEPITGAPIDGKQRQHQYLAGADGTTEALTIIDAELGADPKDVAAGAISTGQSAALLVLLGSTIPMVAGILGVIALLLGFFLATRSRTDESEADEVSARAPGGSGNVNLTKE